MLVFLILASCRTYFESLQKKARMNTPENAEKKAKVMEYMRLRQRKQRVRKRDLVDRSSYPCSIFSVDILWINSIFVLFFFSVIWRQKSSFEARWGKSVEPNCKARANVGWRRWHQRWRERLDRQNTGTTESGALHVVSAASGKAFSGCWSKAKEAHFWRRRWPWGRERVVHTAVTLILIFLFFFTLQWLYSGSIFHILRA